MTNLLPVVKQRVHAAAGLSGVVGGSARGQISRGSWEIPRGGCGDVPNAGREDITVSAALVGSRKGPYERGSGVTPVEQRVDGVTIEQIEGSEAGVQGFVGDIQESLRAKTVVKSHGREHRRKRPGKNQVR